VNQLFKLRILGTVLAVIATALSGYSLISGNNELMLYANFFSGATFLIIGIISIKEKWNLFGIAFIILSIFTFLTSIKGLFFNQKV
jgi:hypothetical protein